MKMIRWLYPGLRIKRWLILLVLSIFFVIFSAVRFVYDSDPLLRVFDVVLFVFSFSVFVAGVKLLIESFFEAIYPGKNKELIDIIYEKRFLSKGPKIVAIGGGTGLSTLLEGLKEYTANITAIVTVADEGGSSGRLREEFGILPPGDIRNCLVSLAEVPKMMRDLFQYRFQEGDGIKGHSFGNLFITAMTQVTGSFKDAIEESSIVLAIRGRVLPSSLDRIRLKAEYSDGTTKEGEDKIPDEDKSIKRISLLPQDAKPNPEAIEAIREAEIIVLGPGSLFTSVIPNLLISQISEEIAKRDVMKLYICNVMTQNGETNGFTAFDHLDAIISHVKKNLFNVCLVNSGRLEHRLLVKYAQEKSFPVIFDRERFKKRGISIFEASVVSSSNYLRHDSQKLAKEVINIYNYRKRRWNVWKNK
ncbi:MAG: YvcK family protein [Candidatus Omnitrophica bacterium]|nr:YvcK family protein [Candidatus Omnitrophota bacterium]MBU2044177.1 YvcK family protein [Candidatus Omnitrophota bacterium]MBU2251035.1 YvcK family protein [Candidatus Omnitrophota bacterium]MBU2473509.1 YvcK family protein [Candidatus Omnitrophota bacterium]